MEIPGLMSPAAIRKEIERRKPLEEAARAQGRARNASAHAARIEDLDQQEQRNQRTAAEFRQHTAPTAPETAPQPDAAKRPYRELAPSPDVPHEAVQLAAELIQRFGAAGAIRGLDTALRQAIIPASQAADISDGVRMLQMRNRVQP